MSAAVRTVLGDIRPGAVLGTEPVRRILADNPGRAFAVDWR